jgi:hypothetical protein
MRLIYAQNIRILVRIRGDIQPQSIKILTPRVAT